MICYNIAEWQAGNLNWKGSVTSLRNDIYKVGIGYIWTDTEGMALKDVM
jgi:hypothetical protein